MAASSTAQPQTVAGHPIAMKVGGRRISVSKSPGANKSFLAGSPPKHATAAPTDTTDSTKTSDGAPLSPNADSYPRPEDQHNGDKDKEKQHKEEQQKNENAKKDKPHFDAIKQQNVNKNPKVNMNHSIKQPAGKTM